MTERWSAKMNRRTALKLGAQLGVLGGIGLAGGYQLVPPSPSREIDRVDLLAQRLFASLDAEQRTDTCVPYDHPLRQYHNRGVMGGGRDILFGFSRNQRKILTDLMYAGLSDDGRSRVPEEFFTRWSGVHALRVVMCGDPQRPPYQVILTGNHLNLRLGGTSREGAAFGGPQVYGDQRGNERPGLPGNVYRDQFLLAQRMLRNLDASRRELAILNEAPVQTGIELQGRGGSFPGVAVSSLAPADQALARDLVERILATYPADDVAYARACLQANGGVDGLFLSYYQHGQDGAIAEGQVFRLEGPAAVLHFRGFPHVHAFVNVAMNGQAPLSSGEPLAENPTWLDRAGVKTLFETAMRTETGSDLAYYPPDSVAGRLRPGVIHSGDIYSLESWQEAVEVVDVHGSNLSATMLVQLRASAHEPDLAKTYAIATTAHAAGNLKEQLGRIDARRPGGMLRDLTAAYLQRPRVGGVPGCRQASGFRRRAARGDQHDRAHAGYPLVNEARERRFPASESPEPAFGDGPHAWRPRVRRGLWPAPARG